MSIQRRISSEPTSEKFEKPSLVTSLPGAKDEVCHILFIQENSLIVAACADGTVLVYDSEPARGPRVLFEGHSGQVNGLLQLSVDTIASVGDDRRLLSWNPMTAVQLSSWTYGGGLLRTIAEIDEAHVVVGTGGVGAWNGEVLILTHEHGRYFQLVNRLKNAHSDWVHNVVVHSDVMVTCSHDETAKIWSTRTLDLLATLRHDEAVYCADLNHQIVVTCCSDGRLFVYKRDASGFHPKFVIQACTSNLKSVAILSDDILAVAGNCGWLSFVSLSSKAVLARSKLTDGWLESFDILIDGRIIAGGKSPCSTQGFCALFSPPSIVCGAVTEYVTARYTQGTAKSNTAHPLQDAWDACQSLTLSLRAACNIITPESCARSLDQWCFAHFILMEAVKAKVVPTSKDIKETHKHWRLVLYQRIAKLQVGEKDISFIISRFKEAELSGVIAEGMKEVLIDIVRLCVDVDKNKRHAVCSIYKLFMKQIEMDGRLLKVFHYHRIGQMKLLFCAILGTDYHSIPDPVTKMADTQVFELVDTLMRQNSDDSWNRNPNGCLTDIFLKFAEKTLEELAWEELEEKHRKAIGDAGKSLNINVAELREKLTVTARMQWCPIEEPTTKIIPSSSFGAEEYDAGYSSSTSSGTTKTSERRRGVEEKLRRVGITIEDLQEVLLGTAIDLSARESNTSKS